MKNWKTKLFGDNSMNFYCWLVAGLVVIGGSVYFAKRALDAEQYLSSQTALLIAIYFLVLGCFGVVLHNYLVACARPISC